MITVHGRTRQQFYTGVADWTAVVATLESTRQEVRGFWTQATGEQDG